jgi:glycerophosphoryl diester phosphodiesterase
VHHSAVRLIGHAGLALDRPAGAPDRHRLERAVALGVDRLEVDVAVCASGDLVLVHDLDLPGGGRVEALVLDALRARLPGLLTLDEAIDHLGGRVPLLLDLKGDCAQPLAARLRHLPDPDGLAVCTDDVGALLVLRHMAPRVPRWRTLPATGDGPGSGRRRIIGALTRSALPARLPLLAAEVGAAAICVDHYAVTRRLCDHAHALGMQVDAWTVDDNAVFQRVLACGVDLVTTDLVEALRRYAG